MRQADLLGPSCRGRASLLLGIYLGLMGTTFPVHAQQSDAAKGALSKTRSMAATQHEIVMLLMDKKEFAKALTEAAKIFEMSWPPDQEPVLLKELLFFSDKFLHEGGPSSGLQLLETCSKPFKTTTSRIAIWQNKGFLYKKTNQNDKALDCFREAQKLETAMK